MSLQWQSNYCFLCVQRGFPGGTVVKNWPANAGGARDVGSTPGLGRSPGGGNGNPLQYSCLENSMHRGSWRATGPGVTQSRTGLSSRADACKLGPGERHPPAEQDSGRHNGSLRAGHRDRTTGTGPFSSTSLSHCTKFLSLSEKKLSQ